MQESYKCNERSVFKPKEKAMWLSFDDDNAMYGNVEGKVMPKLFADAALEYEPANTAGELSGVFTDVAFVVDESSESAVATNAAQIILMDQHVGSDGDSIFAYSRYAYPDHVLADLIKTIEGDSLPNHEMRFMRGIEQPVKELKKCHIAPPASSTCNPQFDGVVVARDNGSTIATFALM